MEIVRKKNHKGLIACKHLPKKPTRMQIGITNKQTNKQINEENMH
jgi:hypothetical protein